MLENLSRCFHLLSDLQDQSTQFNDTRGYTPPQVTSGEVGRPKFDISVEHLLDTGLSCSSIATSLGVSLRTIRRQIYGLSVRTLYTTISDSHLDSIVELYFQIVDTACWMVTFGAWCMCNTEKSERSTLNRRDPRGIRSAVRWATLIQCRQYHVVRQVLQ